MIDERHKPEAKNAKGMCALLITENSAVET
jgi:hypothetical protein